MTSLSPVLSELLLLVVGKVVSKSKVPSKIFTRSCLLPLPNTNTTNSTAAADLLAHTFKSLISRSKIDPNLVEDISVGNVLSPGAGATEYRAAALVAGFPETTAVKTLNRQCSSGLQACVDIVHAIRCGMIDIGVGAGVESMSTQYGPGAVSEFSELLDSYPEAKNCKVPMGVLSEQMASDRSITRERQDAFAARSFQRAEAAQKAGKFDEEIVPMKVKWVDPKTEEEKEILVDKDDGVRAGMTVEGLGKIKPAFKKDGSIHAGNASQVSDGAAAVLLMKRSTAERLGQSILGKFVCSSVVGVKPLLMGIGPWKAIPVALEKAGISKEEVDVWEINEAFASQCVWCVKELGLDEAKVCLSSIPFTPIFFTPCRIPFSPYPPSAPIPPITTISPLKHLLTAIRSTPTAAPSHSAIL